MAPAFLETVSDTDLKRFACCYLASDRSNVDWEKALALFGSDAKLASFKTVTGKATTKVLKSIDENGTGGGGDASSSAAADGEPKPKKPAAGKRKKAAGEDDEAGPKKKKGGKAAAKSKKTVTPEPEENEDQENSVPVKGEETEDDGGMS